MWRGERGSANPPALAARVSPRRIRARHREPRPLQLGRVGDLDPHPRRGAELDRLGGQRLLRAPADVVADLERGAERVAEVDRALEAIGGGLGERLRDQHLELDRRLRQQPAERRGRRLHVIAGDEPVAAIVGGEGELAGEHLEQQHAGAVQIAARIERAPLDLLRAHVRDRPRDQVPGLAGDRLGDARDPVVGELGDAVDAQQEVVGLDVAVDDPERVRRRQRAEQLLEVVPRPVERQARQHAHAGAELASGVGLARLALDQRAERLAADELDRDRARRVHVGDAVEAHHARMVERRQDPRLVGEQLADAPLLRERRVQDLDRGLERRLDAGGALRVQPRVVDEPHPAFAERAIDHRDRPAEVDLRAGAEHRRRQLRGRQPGAAPRALPVAHRARATARDAALDGVGGDHRRGWMVPRGMLGVASARR
ncbi:MAG: hypothetical protein NVS3B10_02990 [Polyangiales bacterium]